MQSNCVIFVQGDVVVVVLSVVVCLRNDRGVDIGHDGLLVKQKALHLKLPLVFTQCSSHLQSWVSALHSSSSVKGNFMLKVH